MTIRSKVVGGFVLVSLLFVGLSFVNYRRSLVASRQLTLINELFLPLSRIIVQLQGHVHGLAEDSKRLQAIPEESSQRGTFSRMVRDLYPYLIFRKIAAAEALLRKNEISGQPKDIHRVMEQVNGIRQALERATKTTSLVELEPIYQEARNRLQDASRIVEEHSQHVTAAAQLDAKENLRLSVIISALFLLVGGASVWVSSRALRPLPALIESIKYNASSGDSLKSLKVDPGENNEFSLLTREYNKMLLALAERDKKIQSQQIELLQSERLATVGKLSAEIVHEIRNPLNAISLNIEWMASELRSPNLEIQKTFGSVAREITRLNEITERYLMQARVNERNETTVELNELIEELLEFLKEEHRSRGIEVNRLLHEKGLNVRADRTRLKQAFLNILRNSRQAMPNGGTITIRSSVHNNTCEVVFEDMGCGMSDATLQNVFRPFFSTKPNGNGLGLMLTRTVIEESHGRLNLNSKMGSGTQCQVQLPASFA